MGTEITPRSRGRCAVCGYSVALRKDGFAQNHRIFGIGFGGAPLYCKGGQREPLREG